jgi:predicted nuclease of restriction endonuclease-like (RecB) superfamily
MASSPARRDDALPADYAEFLSQVKARVTAARTKTVLAVNASLIALYWEIGRNILDREQREGWGSRVIDHLATDLRRAFPDMTGLSRSNLKYMRAFAEAWPRDDPDQLAIGQQPVGQLPWGQNIALLTKLGARQERLWYAEQAIEHGWSRKVLEAQIASDLRGRQGSAYELHSSVTGARLGAGA